MSVSGLPTAGACKLLEDAGSAVGLFAAGASDVRAALWRVRLDGAAMHAVRIDLDGIGVSARAREGMLSAERKSNAMVRDGDGNWAMRFLTAVAIACYAIF